MSDNFMRSFPLYLNFVVALNVDLVTLGGHHHEVTDLEPEVALLTTLTQSLLALPTLTLGAHRFMYALQRCGQLLHVLGGALGRQL